MVPADPSAYRVVATLSCPRIREGAPGVCYVALQRNPDAGFGTVVFTTELRFNIRECDPSRNYEPAGDPTPEEYPVNDVDITPADYIAKVPVADFRGAWDAVGAEGEQMETFGLPFKTVAEAVVSRAAARECVCEWGRAKSQCSRRRPRLTLPLTLLPTTLSQTATFDTLGMAPCDGTGAVKAGTNKHQAFLSGVFLGGIKVLARMQVTLDASSGCVLKVAVRAEDPGVAELVMSCIS